MDKLNKIELEMQRAREKIAEWQARMRELDGKRTEQENLQIVQAVRALKLTREELAAFLSGGKLPGGAEVAIPAERYSRKKRDTETPDTTTNFESEDNHNESE